MFLSSISNDLLEGVRSETDTVGLVEFGLELDPVQTKGVKETFQDIHSQQHSKGDSSKKSETNVGGQPVDFKSSKHALLPENGSKFGVSKRQGPKTEVRGRVGNHTENELNSFNGLVDKNLTKAMFFVVFIVILDNVFVVGILHLMLQDVRLGQQENRDRSERKNEEVRLDFGLAGIHRIIDISWCKSNVDEGRNQVRRLATITGTTKVKRTEVGSSSAVETVNTGGSTVTISLHVAHRPVLLPVATLGVEAGSGKHAFIPVNAPFHEDQDDHVNEQGRSEDNHGNNLEIQVELLSKVDGVHTLQDSTAEHLEDTKDNTQLHLKRVEEKKFVGSDMPHRIQTKWVNRFVGTIFSSLVGNISFFDLHGVLTIEFPTTSEEIETKREAIVVDHTGINSEESHHQNHVTSEVETFRQLVALDAFGLLLVRDQHKTGEEQKHTVSNITIHNSEEEWESGSGKQGRVGFSITRNTVRVDKLLVSICELVGHKVGRRSRPRLRDVVDKTWHGHVHVGVSFLDGKLNLFEVLANDPSFSAEHARDISLEHVKGVVNSLLLQDVPSPTFAVLRKHLAESVTGILILQKDSSRVDELLGVVSQHVIDRFGIVHIRETVPVSLESVTNLLELDFNGFGLVEDDENRLLGELSSLGIGDRLLDGCESDEAVTTGSTENHAFKVGALFGRDNTSDGRETHVQVGADFFLQQQVSLVGGSSGSGQLTDGQARTISDEESASLLQNLLQFNLFVVLNSKLFTVVVQLLELGFVSLEFGFQGFQDLSGIAAAWLQEIVNLSCGFAFDVELSDFS